MMKPERSKSKSRRSPWIMIISLVLCVLMVGGLVTGALMTMVGAASSSEIQKTINGLKDQAQEIADQGAALQKEIDANQSSTQSTIDQKADIDKQISITEAEIQNSNALIQQYSLLIAEKQSELEDALARQQEMNETYKARLRAMEETGTISYWAVLFKATSFSDLLSRIDSIQEVAEADQRMLAELESISKEIEEDRQALETELAAQQEIKDALAEQEKTLEAQRAEADALLLDLAAAYDNLTDEYLANEAQEEALRKEIMEAQAAYEAALSAEEAERLAQQNQNNVAGSGSSSNVTPSSSGFVSPLPAGIGSYVTCAYGWRIHPIWGDRRFHSGVDLAASQGTPIYAIAAGTVTTATYGDANGYYVALSHGNGYGSVYCHMTNYTVSVGDYVSQGEIIGYVGSTGWSTGPHLHFEIHVNGNTVNPMDYISVS